MVHYGQKFGFSGQSMFGRERWWNLMDKQSVLVLNWRAQFVCLSVTWADIHCGTNGQIVRVTPQRERNPKSFNKNQIHSCIYTL